MPSGYQPVGSWDIVLAPSKAPEPVMQLLKAAIRKALQVPEVAAGIESKFDEFAVLIATFTMNFLPARLQEIKLQKPLLRPCSAFRRAA